MQNSPEKLQRLQRNLGLEFNNPDLLLEAITHSTYSYEHKDSPVPDNERLEFLGDAVLDLAISDILFRRQEAYEEGVMTKTRALLVCENCLAELAGRLELGRFLYLGKGEEATGGRTKPSNLANAMEALLGAVFLDSDFVRVRDLIEKLMHDAIDKALAGKIFRDYKSRFLEMVQADNNEAKVKFIILDEAGPVHERIFTAGIMLEDKLIAQGKGSSKKEAEQQAARQAIDIFLQ